MKEKISSIIFLTAMILGLIFLLTKISDAQDGGPPPPPPGLHWHFFNGEDGTPMVMATQEEFEIHVEYVAKLMDIIKQMNHKYINNGHETFKHEGCKP